MKYSFIFSLNFLLLWVFLCCPTKAYSQNADKFFQEGKELFEKGEFSAAIASFDQAIAQKEDYAVAYIERGRAKANLKFFSSALNDLSKGISIDSTDKEFYRLRAAIKQISGRGLDAVEDYDRILELDPKDAEAYRGRAEVYGSMGEYRKAYQDYSSLLILEPSNIEAYFARSAMSYQIKNYQGAIDDCSKVLEIDPNNINAFFNRGKYWFVVKRFDDALKDFTKVIEMDAEDAEAYYFRGLTFQNAGGDNNLKRACEDWKKAQELGVTESAALIEKHCQ